MSAPGRKHAVVIGAGPAGLMAAEVLAQAGWAVTVHEKMPSVGRKFLMAGRGGLNLTHSEPLEPFLERYGAARGRIEPLVRAFPPEALAAWADGLGAETFTGSSGRVFPRAMKASPLLRAWLARLGELGVEIRTRSEWTGWDADGALTFAGAEPVRPDATVLALGGASWPRLGSDGGWVPLLAARGVGVTPLRPSNMGVEVAWTDIFRGRFAGQPVKNVAVSFGGRTALGELMITEYGLEGGAIYALSGLLRDEIEAKGDATLSIDLKPSRNARVLTEDFAKFRRSESQSNRMRKAGLALPAAGLVREARPNGLPYNAAELVGLIKALPLRITGFRGLERAISSAGGVRWDAVDDDLMLKAIPGVFVAGEMLDWEAPTGGYLLQACFASGVAAAKGVLDA